MSGKHNALHPLASPKPDTSYACWEMHYSMLTNECTYVQAHAPNKTLSPSWFSGISETVLRLALCSGLGT